MRPGKDRGCRLAAQLVERDEGIVSGAQTRRPFLDEAADERSVLVERRPVTEAVLLEREGQVGTALVELPEEEGERPEGEAPQGELKVWRASRHLSGYAPEPQLPASPDEVSLPDKCHPGATILLPAASA